MEAVVLPGCKSLSARALVLAAGARGASELRGLSDSADTRTLAAALGVLGARCEDLGGDRWRVAGLGGPPRGTGFRLDAGEAATNFRFLACLVAAGECEAFLTGSPRLLERPHAPLYEFLREHGARVEPAAGGVRIAGHGLRGGRWEAPAGASSQFLSGLALAAAWSGEVRLALPAPLALLPSAGYLELTLDAIRAFRGEGTVALAADTEILLRPGRDEGRAWNVPADASAATFFLVAAARRRRPLRCARAWAAHHPEARLDARWIEESGLLRARGTDPPRFEPAASWPVAELHVDLDPAPDAGPALAVLAAALPAGIRFRGLARLRLKESDRRQGMIALAQALGAPHEERGEELWIRAGEAIPPPAAPFDPRGDHRLAMAAAAGGLEVTDRACAGKSFPRFWGEWNAWSRP